MSKNSKGIFFRYEFSNETGKLEGGDIFEFPNIAKVLTLLGKIIKVAHGDEVAVNITMGREKPFFGFLKNVGISRADAEREMVHPVAKTAKKAAAKKKPAAKKKKK